MLYRNIHGWKKNQKGTTITESGRRQKGSEISSGGESKGEVSGPECERRSTTGQKNVTEIR